MNIDSGRDNRGNSYTPSATKPLEDNSSVEIVQARTKLLTDANTIITKDRAATHGKAEDSFGNIAMYWSAYLSQKLGNDFFISSYDVAQMMVLFKVVRAASNPGHRDNHLDMIGYAALGGEIAERRYEPS